MARTAVRSGLEKTSKRWDVSLFRNVSTATREASLFTNASAASGLHLNDDTTRAMSHRWRTSCGSSICCFFSSSSPMMPDTRQEEEEDDDGGGALGGRARRGSPLLL